MNIPSINDPYQKLSDEDLWSEVGLEDGSTGATGDLVEEYIKRNIITGVSFDGGSYMLNLEREGGTPLTTKIELSEPVRGLEFEFIGWSIDNGAIISKTIPVNISKDNKVEAIVKFENYTLVKDENDEDKKVNSSLPFRLKVKVGNYAEKILPATIQSNLTSHIRINVTDVFKSINVATSPSIIFTVDVLNTLSSTGNYYYATFTNSDSTNNLNIYNPKISYTKEYFYTEGNNIFEFNVDYFGSEKYTIYINNTALIDSQNPLPNFEFGGTNSYGGVFPDFDENNICKFLLKVLLTGGISSNTLNVMLLRASGEKVLVVINPVSNSIKNFDLNSLYNITIYNPSVNDVSITTKIFSRFDKLFLNKTKIYESSLFTPNKNYCYSTLAGVFLSIEDLNLDSTNCLYKLYLDEQEAPFFEYSGLTILASNNYAFTSGEIYDFSQINTLITSNSYEKNPFDVNLLRVLAEFGNGVTEENDITFIKVQLDDLLTKQLSNIGQVKDGFTFEIDFRTYNVADYYRKVLLIGNIIIYPDKIELQGITNSEAYFSEGERTRISVTFNKGVKMRDKEYPNIPMTTSEGNKYNSSKELFSSLTINLIRIYINGCIAREVSYVEDSIGEIFGQKVFTVNPESCDIDIYATKFYNNGLSMKLVENNFISYQTDVKIKDGLVAENDIIDENDYVSYNLAVKTKNCITYVYPKGKYHPTLFAYDKDNGVKGVSIFVDIHKKNANGDFIEEMDLQHSGVFRNAKVKPQGSSAMKYYAHNSANDIKVDKEDPSKSTGLFTSDDGSIVDAGLYYMPDDTGNSIKVKKMCGKANIASSMQSHKIGATRFYEDFAPVSSKLEKGRHTVLEEPFLCFIWETDLENVNSITKEDLLGSNEVRFWGFLTWGSAKKDKGTWGYSDDTPDFFVFEGAEDNTPLTLWHLPWIDEDIVLDGETFKSKSSAETNDGWDVDFGLDSNDEDGNTLDPNVAANTFPIWKEFFNFVWEHTINLEMYRGSSDITTVDPIKEGLDINKKYIIQQAIGSCREGNVYRYDYITNKFVNAGSSKNNGVYTEFNIIEYLEKLGYNPGTIEDFKLNLIDDFKKKIEQWLDINDWAYHQAFVRIFAGTDNRAKNTYFALRTVDSKIQAFQDDLDTIIRSDNRGQFTIPYYVLEDDKYSEYSYIWNGHDNEFFILFERAFRDEILSEVERIVEKIEKEDSLTNYFFKYLKYFPIRAYNRAAHLHYEGGQILLNSGCIDGYSNNSTPPLSQSLGRALEAELQFMRKRMTMFYSLAKCGSIFAEDAGGIPINADEGFNLIVNISVTPSLYFYPVWGSGSATYHVTGNKYIRVAENDTVSATIAALATTSIKGRNYIKEINNYSLINYRDQQNRAFNLTSSSLLKFDASLLPGQQELKFLPTEFTLNTPVLRVLNLSGVNSFSNLDLNKAPKLEELYLSNTAVKNLILPDSKYLRKIELPNTLEVFSSSKNPNLTTIIIPNDEFTNIRSLKFDAGNKSNTLVFEKLIRASLKSDSLLEIQILNVDLTLTAKELEKLSEIATLLTGKITVVGEDSISFKTKKNLVDKFGDILSKTNPKRLFVDYGNVSIVKTSIFVNSEINIYGDEDNYPITVSPDVFGLEITRGNDVVVENGKLSITYAIESGTGAYFDENGNFVVSELSENSVNVIIKITTYNNGSPLTYSLKVKVWLKWRAPEVGDYAYADGTFSSLYDSNRTVVGLVYHTVPASSTKGTAYIIGTEYINDKKYKLGFSNEGDISAAEGTTSRLLYNVSEFLNNHSIDPKLYGQVGIYSNLYDLYDITNQTNVFSNYPSIKGDTEVRENILSYSGKSDTLAYVKHVSNLLMYLTDTYGSYFRQNAEDGLYYIKDTTSLNNLITDLNNLYNQLASCVLFPYFYSAYLYEPVLTNYTETLHKLYRANNWYVPSAGELCRVIQARGFSANASFPASSSVMEKVDSSAENIKNLPIAIFAKAKREMSSKYPSVYDTLFTNESSQDYYSIVTLQGENTDGFYQNYVYGYTKTRASNTYIYNYSWQLGSNTTTTNNVAGYIWRLNSLKVIPYTLFEYEK